MTTVYKLKDYSQTFRFEKEHPKELRWDDTLKRWMLESNDKCQGIWIKDNDMLIGEIILSWDSSNVVNIESITVVPDRRREGIGTKLVTTAMDWAEMSGYKYLIGEARKGASWNLFENLGAVPILEYTNWGGTGENYMFFKLAV